MPAMLMEEDLSLRHLPEVSDYSFSFQIPTSSIPKGDDLMADDITFFEGANNKSIFATPAPPARATTLPFSDSLLQLTPGPFAAGSSPAHQQLRNPSLPGSQGTSYRPVEPRPSPITQMPASSGELGSSEVKAPLKEKGDHKLQDQEEPRGPCTRSSTSMPSSSALSKIPSPPPKFVEGSPLGSQSEVGRSQSDLPPIQSQSQASSGKNRKEERISKPRSVRKPSFKNQSEHLALTEGVKVPKRSTVIGGIMKSRSRGKTATTRSESSKVDSFVRPITSRAGHEQDKQPTKPENLTDTSAVDKPLGSDPNVSSFVSVEGAAGRLVMYSQQLMNVQSDTTRSPHCMEPNNLPEGSTVLLETLDVQDINMNLGDRQVGPFAGYDNHANDAGDQDDDRDKPLTMSQISPRKRSAEQITAVERPDAVPYPPPMLPALELMPTAPGALSKKRPASPTITNCHSMQTRKKSRGNAIAMTLQARSGSPVAVPPRPAAFTSGDFLPNVVPTTSSEMGLNGSRATVNGLGVIKENEGVREVVHEENVVDVGHAKTEPTPEMISTSGGGSYQAETGSGSSTNAKKAVKRMFGHGARDRVRRVSKISSSGRSLRPRSVSNSVSSRAEVLHASERGRRLAQVRTRKEARRNDKRSKPGEVELNSGEVEETSSTDEQKRSGMTYPASTTRPVEFKFASDLRIQARKGDGERMTRSTSSLSRSSSDINTGRRTHPVPNYQTIHTTQDAELAHRKENIHPVIPQPFQWATEQRTKERRKFDEMIKEKEKEREQLEEQKRREREEEEEREVRELRKRAVPKANVVPDWYKDAPRKRKDEETVDSGSR